VAQTAIRLRFGDGANTRRALAVAATAGSDSSARPIRFCRRLYLRANSRSMLKPPPAVTNAKTRPPIMARFL
jgi:hypothetical protein